MIFLHKEASAMKDVENNVTSEQQHQTSTSVKLKDIQTILHREKRSTGKYIVNCISIYIPLFPLFFRRNTVKVGNVHVNNLTGNTHQTLFKLPKIFLRTNYSVEII